LRLRLTNHPGCTDDDAHRRRGEYSLLDIRGADLTACSSYRHSRRSVAVSPGLIGGLGFERTGLAHPTYHHTPHPRGYSQRQRRSIQRHEPDTQVPRSIDRQRPVGVS